MSKPLLMCWLLTIVGLGAQAAEQAPADAPWRPHRLERCDRPSPPSPAVRDVLEEARLLYGLGNGGDAAVVLEDGLSQHPTSQWIRLFLAQVYVQAGQGEPYFMPTGGPAAPRGHWPDDRRRCLERADLLLSRIGGDWRDDGIVWFLRADVARALDQPEIAGDHDLAGRRACTRQESLDFIAELRGLGRKPAEVLTPIVPDYPEECLRRRIEGRVELDLLVDPEGRVAQWVPANRADRRLQEAAGQAASAGGFQAARVGYYPIWSWIRVTVSFALEN